MHTIDGGEDNDAIFRAHAENAKAMEADKNPSTSEVPTLMDQMKGRPRAARKDKPQGAGSKKPDQPAKQGTPPRKAFDSLKGKGPKNPVKDKHITDFKD